MISDKLYVRENEGKYFVFKEEGKHTICLGTVQRVEQASANTLQLDLKNRVGKVTAQISIPRQSLDEHLHKIELLKEVRIQTQSVPKLSRKLLQATFQAKEAKKEEEPICVITEANKKAIDQILQAQSGVDIEQFHILVEKAANAKNYSEAAPYITQLLKDYAALAAVYERNEKAPVHISLPLHTRLSSLARRLRGILDPHARVFLPVTHTDKYASRTSLYKISAAEYAYMSQAHMATLKPDDPQIEKLKNGLKTGCLDSCHAGTFIAVADGTGHGRLNKEKAYQACAKGFFKQLEKCIALKVFTSQEDVEKTIAREVIKYFDDDAAFRGQLIIALPLKIGPITQLFTLQMGDSRLALFNPQREEVHITALNNNTVPPLTQTLSACMNWFPLSKGTVAMVFTDGVGEFLSPKELSDFVKNPPSELKQALPQLVAKMHETGVEGRETQLNRVDPKLSDDAALSILKVL